MGNAMVLARFAATSDFVVWEALEQFFDALDYTSVDGYTGFDEFRGLPIVAPSGLGECLGQLYGHWGVNWRCEPAGDRACTHGQFAMARTSVEPPVPRQLQGRRTWLVMRVC